MSGPSVRTELPMLNWESALSMASALVADIFPAIILVDDSAALDDEGFRLGEEL